MNISQHIMLRRDKGKHVSAKIDYPSSDIITTIQKGIYFQQYFRFQISLFTS